MSENTDFNIEQKKKKKKHPNRSSKSKQSGIVFNPNRAIFMTNKENNLKLEIMDRIENTTDSEFYQ